MASKWKIIKRLTHSRCTNPWAPKAEHKYYPTDIGVILKDENGKMQLKLHYTPTAEGTIWVNDMSKPKAVAVVEADEESPF